MLREEYETSRGSKWDTFIGCFCGECDSMGCRVMLTPPCLLYGENCLRAYAWSQSFWSCLFFLPCLGLGAAVAGILLSIPVYDTSKDPSVPLLALFSALFVLSYLTMVVMGVTSRRRMKKKFNIGDRTAILPSVAWILCPFCALCQETRTLRLNNVHDGIWEGGSLPRHSWKYRLSTLLGSHPDLP